MWSADNFFIAQKRSIAQFQIPYPSHTFPIQITRDWAYSHQQNLLFMLHISKKNTTFAEKYVFIQSSDTITCHIICIFCSVYGQGG